MYELPVAAPRRHKKQPSSSIIDIASRTFMARPGATLRSRTSRGKQRDWRSELTLDKLCFS
jgi:hypothetical protein